jgi:hypothetical protein
MKKIALIVFVIGCLVGCAPFPKIQYAKIVKPSDLTGEETDTFSFRATQINIEKIESAAVNSNAGDNANFSVVSLPIPVPDFKIAMRRADSWGVKTNLTVTKIENTSLIKEIGVDVVDSRTDLISKYGGMVVKLITLVPFDSGDLDNNALPKKINVSVVLNSANVAREAMQGIDAADGVTIDFGAIPVDARAAIDYQYPVTLSGIMYPACRTAIIRFKYKNHKYEKSVAISDPRFLAYVAFPKSGKISFHSECGVSQSATKDGPDTSTGNITDALLAQGKAIKDALDAANKK